MVAISSPRFKLQMWQGCSWNSFSFWFAYGMFKNGFYSECKKLTERILDATAKIYEETGKIWEFYHPFGRSPLELARGLHFGLEKKAVLNRNKNKNKTYGTYSN